jgi:ATP-dependent RNA helicase DDX54/DBP10
MYQFARAGLRDPQLIRLDTETRISEQLRIAFFLVRTGEKVAALIYLVRFILPADQMTVIFVPTRHHVEVGLAIKYMECVQSVSAQFLHELLKHIGKPSALVYGEMDQEARTTSIANFRKGMCAHVCTPRLLLSWTFEQGASTISS